MISYFESRYVFKVDEFGFAISAQNYYNFMRKMVPDKNKPKIINDLFITLQKTSFVYHCRVKIKKNEEENLINRKTNLVYA
jgi:hypothetical protein